MVEIESAEGIDVTEPPQATVAKTSTAVATIKVCNLNGLIFLLVTTVIVWKQKSDSQVLATIPRYNRVHVKALDTPLGSRCADDGGDLRTLLACLHRVA